MQRAMFASNLRREFVRMSRSLRKDDLYALAKTYLDDGHSPDEVAEILILDNFDPVMARSCVSAMANDSQSEVRWDFDVEDECGDVATGSSMGISISANTEDEAWEMAEEAVMGLATARVEVVRVFRTG